MTRRPTRRVDATLSVLGSLDHDVSRRGAYVAYFGSGEFPVRVRVLGTQSLIPGAEGVVRLHLPHPLALLPGGKRVLVSCAYAGTVEGFDVSIEKVKKKGVMATKFNVNIAAAGQIGRAHV